MPKRYEDKQILVWFKDDAPMNSELATYLGKQIGLRFVQILDETVYVFQTKKGQELAACRLFKDRYKEFVESTDRRDILYEQRYAKFEALEKKIEELKDEKIGTTEPPTSKQFNASLDALIRQIEKAKE
ncbi:hypothetical protein KA107_00175 [Candidatus Pacearchaeota archaeon]|nr:hypothetical protein [Candidatus Pacearchaeota archaeon]